MDVGEHKSLALPKQGAIAVPASGGSAQHFVHLERIGSLRAGAAVVRPDGKIAVDWGATRRGRGPQTAADKHLLAHRKEKPYLKTVDNGLHAFVAENRPDALRVHSRQTSASKAAIEG